MRFYKLTDDNGPEHYAVITNEQPFFWYNPNNKEWQCTINDGFSRGQTWNEWERIVGPNGCQSINALEVLVVCGKMPPDELPRG